MLDLVEQLRRYKISLEQAAKKTGLPLGRLQEIAAGSEFSLHELRLLSKKLSIPISEFTVPPAKEPEIAVLFRNTPHRHDKREEQIVHRLSREVVDVLDIVNELPPNVAWIEQVRDASSDKDADSLAKSFRALFFNNDQVEPLTSLPLIVSEVLGVVLLVAPSLPADGASVRYRDRAFLFLAPRTFWPRMLFTLAHEIGHFVADHHQKGDFAVFDSEAELKPWAKRRAGVEEFANSFASALLMPAQSVILALKLIREQHRVSGPLGDIEISYLARIFGVSFEVAGRRCEQLDLLPEFGARVLYDRICKEHKNPERRADEAGLLPRGELTFPPPKHLLNLVSRRIRAGDISIGRAAEVLHVSLSQLLSANSENAG